MSIATVTLELLRHGDPDNQLVSPLMQYLALAGSKHEAEPAFVRIKHIELVRRLRRLRPNEAGPGSDDQDLASAARPVDELLGDIKSLVGELSAVARPDTLIHLRLVFSAFELALLPFELAATPKGVAGLTDPWLSLGLVITRERRRTAPVVVDWTRRPRVLFVVARPPGAAIGEPVMASNYMALAEALAPWMVTVDAEDLDQHLKVVDRASVRELQEVCGEIAYTHVHVLAHGAPMADRPDGEERFGIALHDDQDPEKAHVVSGADLADALRTRGRDGAGELPTVVTLATCDSAAQLSVLAGGSVAHDLHAAGVPLVIGSQFPLSERGSVILARETYGPLLRGDDPRRVIRDRRRALRKSHQRNHDWAGIVAYASLPADLEEQLERTVIARAGREVNAALARIDRLTKDAAAEGGGPATAVAGAPERDPIGELEKALQKLKGALPTGEDAIERSRGAQVHGLVAASLKRWAYHLHERRVTPEESPSTPGVWRVPSTVAEALDEAEEHYQRAFWMNMGESWALTQILALDAARGRPIDERKWITASFLAEQSLQATPDPRRKAWAHASLVELAILAQKLPEGRVPIHLEVEALRQLDAVLRLIGARSFDAYATQSQIRRYVDWWWKDDPAARALPERLLTYLRDERRVPLIWDAIDV